MEVPAVQVRVRLVDAVSDPSLDQTPIQERSVGLLGSPPDEDPGFQRPEAALPGVAARPRPGAHLGDGDLPRDSR